MRSLVQVVVAVALLLGARSGLSASEYVGLWRVDEVAPGISVTFPDNGFGGACVAFSNGGIEAGEVRLESQINRHRFDTLTLSASGALDPAVVHVQLAVKGKTAWGAGNFDFAEVPVAVQLDGYEVTIAAKELAEGEGAWTVTMCGMEFSNSRYSLRFTSDCAGFDFMAGDDSVRLVVDEDWLALEREMVGGMGLFELSSAWAGAEVDLTCQTTFPEQLFYSALAVDDKPLLEPQVGVPVAMVFVAGTPGDHALVVKAKGPVVGNADWKTSLGWQVETVASADGVADILGADLRVEVAGETSSDVEAEAGEASANSGSGCRASRGGGGPVFAFLLALLLLLRYYVPTRRKARPRNRL